MHAGATAHARLRGIHASATHSTSATACKRVVINDSCALPAGPCLLHGPRTCAISCCTVVAALRADPSSIASHAPDWSATSRGSSSGGASSAITQLLQHLLLPPCLPAAAADSRSVLQQHVLGSARRLRGLRRSQELRRVCREPMGGADDRMHAPAVTPSCRSLLLPAADAARARSAVNELSRSMQNTMQVAARAGRTVVVKRLSVARLLLDTMKSPGALSLRHFGAHLLTHHTTQHSSPDPDLRQEQQAAVRHRANCTRAAAAAAWAAA